MDGRQPGAPARLLAQASSPPWPDHKSPQTQVNSRSHLVARTRQTDEKTGCNPTYEQAKETRAKPKEKEKEADHSQECSNLGYEER